MGLRVKRTAPFCMGFKGVMVKPGLNNFSDAEAEVLKSDPSFDEQIECGNQSVVGEAVGEESMAEAIMAMNAKLAVKAVREVLDIDVLTELQNREERVSVLGAIEKQIDMLKAEG